MEEIYQLNPHLMPAMEGECGGLRGGDWEAPREGGHGRKERKGSCRGTGEKKGKEGNERRTLQEREKRREKRKEKREKRERRGGKEGKKRTREIEGEREKEEERRG